MEGYAAADAAAAVPAAIAADDCISLLQQWQTNKVCALVDFIYKYNITCIVAYPYNIMNSN